MTRTDEETGPRGRPRWPVVVAVLLAKAGLVAVLVVLLPAGVGISALSGHGLVLLALLVLGAGAVLGYALRGAAPTRPSSHARPPGHARVLAWIRRLADRP
jgi:hypothetical protein